MADYCAYSTLAFAWIQYSFQNGHLSTFDFFWTFSISQGFVMENIADIFFVFFSLVIKSGPAPETLHVTEVTLNGVRCCAGCVNRV